MTTTRPAGNSRAAGLRRLQRYAQDPGLCAQRGIDQGAVLQALDLCQEGALSVSAALRSCGLRPGPVARIQALADELNAAELAEAIASLRGRLQQLDRAG